MRRVILTTAAGLALAWLLCGRPAAAQGTGALAVKHTQNAPAVPRYEVFEITFQHERAYKNPFFDVSIEVAFTSPSGKRVVVGGFHYGSLEKPKITVQRPPDGRGRVNVSYSFDKADIWKARFAPNELGRWGYTYVFANNQGETATGAGEFTCVEGRVPLRGFLRQDANNPFRWVFDDGTPFYPIGLQDMFGHSDGAGTMLGAMALEGPHRMDRTNRPTLPAGAMFQPGPSMNPQNGDVYFRRYARAGFNFFRHPGHNCPLPWSGLDRFLVQEGIMTDELLLHARKYGYRIMLCGDRKEFMDNPDNADGMARMRRLWKYMVDRWGAYTDIWEFVNEHRGNEVSDRWYAAMAAYVRSIDPYRHPITTSFERPQADGIDISSPHWYVWLHTVPSSDQVVAQQAARWKQFGKPVIVGEVGNMAPNDPMKRPPEVGGVWDPLSAQRMRIRNWTALFHEITFVFWNTSYAKDGHFMNQWLGPQERQYVKAMQDFAALLGGGMRMLTPTLSDPKAARAHGLASESRVAAYLVQATDHAVPLKGLALTLQVPKAGRGFWYSPLDGSIVGTFAAAAGTQTIPVPEFRGDLALLIGADRLPDADADGRSNDVDDDDDNDGVADAKDAYPLDAEEWEDRDGDLIGDNLDADVDADGVGDDRNKNGTPDHQEMDTDGDGVPRANAAPWDAFPLDPKEWRDTDGDGIGDNADPDDDGDGYPDEEEKRAGTDPLDRLSFPVGR